MSQNHKKFYQNTYLLVKFAFKYFTGEGTLGKILYNQIYSRFASLYGKTIIVIKENIFTIFSGPKEKKM